MTKPKNDYVPTDYEDLYRYYIVGDGHGNSLCHQIIRRLMPYATPDEKEELAADVFLRAYETDQLKVYDPDKANFGGVIYYVTRTVVSNHLARKGRNPVTGLKAGTLTDAEPEGEGFEPGVYHLDRLFVQEAPNHAERMDTWKLASLLWDRCRELAANPRHKRDASLFPLLNFLAQELDPEECGARLGVTASTIHNWMTIIREMAEEIRANVLTPKKEPLPPGKMLPIEEA